MIKKNILSKIISFGFKTLHEDVVTHDIKCQNTSMDTTINNN